MSGVMSACLSISLYNHASTESGILKDLGFMEISDVFIPSNPNFAILSFNTTD